MYWISHLYLASQITGPLDACCEIQIVLSLLYIVGLYNADIYLYGAVAYESAKDLRRPWSGPRFWVTQSWRRNFRGCRVVLVNLIVFYRSLG
jgi:hypothetical protein